MCRIFVVVFCVFFLWPTVALSGDKPPVMLAQVYDQPVDLKHYWISEKLDGVRAYWDGRYLISRRGNRFHAPEWFTEKFPTIPLDGELWAGRGRFEFVSGTVRRQSPDHNAWNAVRFMVFDLPQSPEPFDRRLQQLKQMFRQLDSPSIALVEQFKVDSEQELMATLGKLVAGGGEGLMLHRGDSLYRAQRSDNLLKLKKYSDAEAVVVGHLPGKGKYTGMLGSLLVETPDGICFRIGSGFSDLDRVRPPAVGTVITYKYFGLTGKGVPRFATFLRQRKDY